jgi:hypothetical protein
MRSVPLSQVRRCSALARRRLLAWALPIGAACAAAACDATPPTRLRVVWLDDDHQHRLRDVPIPAGSDLDQLTSNAIRFRGGGRVVIDGLRFQKLQPAEVDADRLRALARDDVGTAVHLRYTREGEVAVPDDYDSLLMASAYCGLDRVLGFLGEFDRTLATLSTLEVCYRCGQFIDVGIVLPYLVSDNAAYAPFADLLALVPELLLSETPIAASTALLAHETSHRVFHYQVYQGAALRELLRQFVEQTELSAAERRSHNLLRALDEGSADFLAAAFARDPGFAVAGLGALGVERDLTGTRAQDERYDAACGDAAARNLNLEVRADGGHNLGTDGWSPYHLGTIWAGALWRLGNRAAAGSPNLDVDVERLRTQVVPALIAAENELGAALARRFEFDFDRIIAPLVAGLPEEQRGQACTQLATTFADALGAVEVCR